MDKLNKNDIKNDSLMPEVAEYIKKFDFGVASLIQKKFKIGFSRAEKILKEIRRREKSHLTCTLDLSYSII